MNYFKKNLFAFFFLLPIFLQGAVGTITGTITSKDTGLVIPYAGINMIPQSGGDITITTANAQGVYTLGNLQPDLYIFVAAGPIVGSNEYQIFQVGTSITSGGTTTQNAALLTNPGRVEGTVTEYPEGSGLAATVTFTASGIPISPITCSANGEYTITTLPPNYYIISAANTGRITEQQGLQVAAGTLYTDINFSLPINPSTISGTVTDQTTTSPIDQASLVIFT